MHVSIMTYSQWESCSLQFACIHLKTTDGNRREPEPQLRMTLKMNLSSEMETVVVAKRFGMQRQTLCMHYTNFQSVTLATIQLVMHTHTNRLRELL